MNTTLNPTKIKRRNGIAGQFQMDATYTDSYTGDPKHISFVGSTYGGPVVMIIRDIQTFVYDPSRFGDFSTEPEKWINKFFEDA